MNQAFTVIEAIAAPLPVVNVDTDMLFPARFLKTVSRKGLGNALFYAQRLGVCGSKNGEFVLNRAPWQNAQILIGLDNFGCGSSREHAPWALKDFGIRCIIAPSYADIFYGNCFKNGLLPIVLPLVQIELLLGETANPSSARLRVNLEAQTITRSGGEEITFSIDPRRKADLLEGIDEISMSLRQEEDIAKVENARAGLFSWMQPDQDLAMFFKS